MDLVNNLNAIVGEYIHLFNQQIGQLRGQHIRCRNRVNDLLSAALAGLFFPLQLCLGGDGCVAIGMGATDATKYISNILP